MDIEDDEQDDLDDYIAECAKNDPEIPALIEAALQRRREMRARGEDPNDDPDDRMEQAQSDEMKTSQPTSPETTAVHH